MLDLRKNPLRRGFMVAGFIAVVVLTTAADCDGSKFTEPFQDAPRSDVTNSGEADVIEMPDGFSNLTTKCDHGNRIYVAYHGDYPYASLDVVKDDASCKNG